MRVALLSHNARGGDAIGNQVAEKFAFFHERTADVRVFVEDARALHPTLRDHAHAWPHPAPEGEPWRFLASADLVCAEYGQFYPMLTLLPLLARGKTRLLLDYHGVTPPALWGPRPHEALVKGVEQRGLAWCADAVLVHSRYALRELADSCGLPEGRCRLVPYPVDLGPPPAGTVQVDWRRRLGLETARVLLFVGRLAANKRVPVLVEALHTLRDETPPVHALVVGDATDVYEAEAEHCRDLARRLGVADRLHWLGHQTGPALRDAYRAADVFVMPSLWESFCIPVAEAMACGVPVVAARAAALPETVGGAGLTFAPDDADDLARQIRRVLGGQTPEADAARGRRAPRVAVVSFRYGDDFVGGAEASLRNVAATLRLAGCGVEVFATCVRSETTWANELPAGASLYDGVPVHRFPLDAPDRPRLLDAVRAIHDGDGVAPDVEKHYLQNSVRSAALLAALRRRQHEFDAVLVGPYLYGLTYDVAEALPDKTILLPCFHDEPLARLAAWRPVYERVGGVLYHSAEEQHFAQAVLGFNHPGAACLGACLDLAPADDPLPRDPEFADTNKYIIYCGRYSDQKDVPLLLDYARRYAEEHPERFTFAFAGQGAVAVPPAPWARDLGFVSEERKRSLMAHAAALVQLSRHESLSLVALEAWALGVPVLARRSCAALAGHLERCGGGRAVEGYAEFAAALDDLWQQPERWRTFGRRGREYVREHYASRSAYTARLLEAVAGLRQPLVERMRQCGQERVAGLGQPAWRERFAALVEELLDRPPAARRYRARVSPRGGARRVARDTRSVLVAVRVANRGTQPLTAEGPARTLLRCRVLARDGTPVGVQAVATPLPRLLTPGRSLAAVVAVPVPVAAGSYRVVFWAERQDQGDEAGPADAGRALRLVVHGRRGTAAAECCGPLVDAAQAALAEADRLRQLPDDYVDVTDGPLAAWKRKIKRKVLGNFKHAYVDVLSRQQSAFNRQLVAAVQQLAESCATLDHALRVLHDRLARLEQKQLEAPPADAAPASLENGR